MAIHICILSVCEAKVEGLQQILGQPELQHKLWSSFDYRVKLCDRNLQLEIKTEEKCTDKIIYFSRTLFLILYSIKKSKQNTMLLTLVKYVGDSTFSVHSYPLFSDFLVFVQKS